MINDFERKTTVVQRDVKLGSIMDAVQYPRKWCDLYAQDCITLCEIREGDLKYTLCLGFDEIDVIGDERLVVAKKPEYYIDVFVDEGEVEAEGADTYWYNNYDGFADPGLGILQTIMEKYFL